MMGDTKLKHAEITDAILGAYFRVYRNLGHGFLERVYENALVLELRKGGLRVEQQKAMTVTYDGVIVGEYTADIVVNKTIVLELKACRGLAEEHAAQAMNYLKASDLEVGLLLNFGPKPEVRRVLFTNDRKAGAVTQLNSVRVSPSDPSRPCSASNPSS